MFENVINVVKRIGEIISKVATYAPIHEGVAVYQIYNILPSLIITFLKPPT